MVQEKDLIILCGPTAVGKTAAAIELALKIGAEIISADSGQIYRGMDIGTAKPTLKERRGVPIHLIDILDPDQSFSAAEFRRLALQAIEEIQSRGKKIVIVGGTGLYLRALEMGLFEGPPRDPKIREGLENEIRENGVEALHRELQKVDPEAATLIPSKNRQRLIRALEVYRLTGKPISMHWKEHRLSTGGERLFSFKKMGLRLPKEELHQRIDTRVKLMLQQGWVEEVRPLLEKWGDDAPGLQLIGYKETVSFLRGKITLEKAVEQIKLNTRRYAKRQMTWFRRDHEIQWLDKVSLVDKVDRNFLCHRPFQRVKR